VPIFIYPVRRHTSHRALLLTALLLLSALTVFAQTGVHGIAEKVDSHYNHLDTLHADFTESYRGAGMQRTESGTLWLLRPGKMRWQYEKPRPKLFIVNGKTAWFYVSGEQQAQRVNVRSLDDLRTPLAYLLGRTKLEKEFEGLSLAPDQKPVNGGSVVLRGIPVSMKGRVSQVLLEVSPAGVITRITAEEEDGSVTEFRFTNIQENTAVSEAKFKFTPPAGVEVVETKTTQF
jgi:outer membrane lipoprotein carrier protein